MYKKNLGVQVGDLAAKQIYPLHQKACNTQIHSVYIESEFHLNVENFLHHNALCLVMKSQEKHTILQ